ncbi:hypothetical protein AHAS_Ahas16G0279200 [Arachis hypogaea]
MASHSLSVPYLLLPSIHQTHLIDDDNDLITVDRSIFNLSENRCYEWKNILNGHVGAWCVATLLPSYMVPTVRLLIAILQLGLRSLMISNLILILCSATIIFLL